MPEFFLLYIYFHISLNFFFIISKYKKIRKKKSPNRNRTDTGSLEDSYSTIEL
jgi:hypothetical protein